MPIGTPTGHSSAVLPSPTASFLVRRGRPGDAAQVLFLLHQVEQFPSEKSYNETFAQVVRHPETAVFVAQEGAKVLGYLSLCHRAQIHLSGRTSTVDALLVEETRRGEGIGTALLSMAIHFAQSIGCQTVEHHVPRNQESYLRGFHAGHGFSEIDIVQMRLDLDLTKSRM